MTQYLSFCSQYIKTIKTFPSESVTVSKWSTQVKFAIAAEQLATDDQWLFLPPTSKKKITLLIHIEYNNQRLTDKELQIIMIQLDKKKEFWESIYFNNYNDITVERDIRIQLECQLWTQSRINDLLESERLEDCNVEQPSKINFIEELLVSVSFHSTNDLEKELDSFKSHLSEYMASLMISQLEFRFPLVFSKIAKKRVKEQENSFFVISQAIKGNSSLVLKFIRMIHVDQTSLSAFQILSSSEFPANLQII